MAETPTTRAGILKVTVGDDVDSWGTVVNRNWDWIDDAVDGILAIAVSGDVSITNTIDSTDQSHYAALNIVGGSGGRVFLPLKQGLFFVRNGSAGTVTVLNAAATPISNVVLSANAATIVMNDGVSGVFEVGPGGSLKGYIDNVATTAKAYTDQAQFNSASGAFPGQTGNGGKYLSTNGSVASWQQIQFSDVAGATAQTSALRGFAIAMASYL